MRLISLCIHGENCPSIKEKQHLNELTAYLCNLLFFQIDKPNKCLYAANETHGCLKMSVLSVCLGLCLRFSAYWEWEKRDA